LGIGLSLFELHKFQLALKSGGCKEFTISAEESDDDQKKFEVLHSACHCDLKNLACPFFLT
jgi:hypothetical protein